MKIQDGPIIAIQDSRGRSVRSSVQENLSLWLKQHLIVASLIVISCSLGVRLFMTLRSDQPALIKENADAATYLVPAQNLLEEGAFVNIFNQPEITRTPGYPTFLATLMLVVGQDSRKVFIAQAFILSFEVLVLYWLARRILPSLTALVAGLLAAFSPWGAVLAGFPLPEGLFLLLLVLIFFTMKITTEANNRLVIAVGGACTGSLTAAAVLVRPIWPLVFLIAVAFFALYGPKRKGVWLLLSTTLTFAAAPILLWKGRNHAVSEFNGLSDIAGQCASQMLAQRVTAHVNGQDRWALMKSAKLEERNWKMSIPRQDQERWQRAGAVFREHPMLSSYYFLLSGAETAIHPSPYVLSPGKLNFYGDYWVLASVWGGLLVLACLGWHYSAAAELQNGTTARNWLAAVVVVCLLLTFSSGLCFGAGSRYRVPLELLVPMLAAAGLSRIVFCRALSEQTETQRTSPIPASRTSLSKPSCN